MCLVLFGYICWLGISGFHHSRSNCVDNSLDNSLRISSVSEVWDIHMFLVWCVQCMIIHINVANMERSSGFLVSIFKLPAERTTASLSISIRQSVAPILRFHLAPRELPSLSRHEGGSSHRAGDGRALFFSWKHIFLQTWEIHWDKGLFGSLRQAAFVHPISPYNFSRGSIT